MSRTTKHVHTTRERNGTLPWLITLSLVLIVAAGCVSPKTSTTTTTGASTTSTTTTPTQASFAPIHFEHNYTTDAPASKTFTIPSGTPALDVDVYLAGPGAAGAEACPPTQDAHLLVKTPSNETFVNEATSTGGTTGEFHCAEKKLTNHYLDAGTWTVIFSGSGALVGVIDIHSH